MNWQARIEDRELTVGVIGLGYVGLPLAVGFAENGFTVIGFEKDEAKAREVNHGESYLTDISSEQLREVTTSGNLKATTETSRMAECGALIICVPTPLRKSRDPDVSFIAQATQDIIKHYTPPGIVVLESTTYPGTTEEIIASRFEEVGWSLDDDVLLAFSPERIDPSNETFTVQNTPKVVGGITEQSTEVVSDLYEEVVNPVVKVSDPKTAEMVKLLENIFRSINIALANEMAMICDRLEIDAWEVIDAAATKPYGFMPFYPGPGLGGHCIPIDPLYLSWKARLVDTKSQFIELADEVNRSMPGHVMSKITSTLNDEQKCLNGSDICLLGVAYKADVSDVRESPAIIIADDLREHQANVTYCDPHVESFDVHGNTVPRIRQGQLNDKDFDLGVILTGHEDFDWPVIADSISIFLDTRNVFPDELKTESIRVVVL